MKEKRDASYVGKSLNVPMMASRIEKWFSMEITLNCRHPHNHTHCYLWIDDNHAVPAAHWNIFGVVYAPTIRTVLTLIINDYLSIWLTSRSAVRAVGMREIELHQLIKLSSGWFISVQRQTCDFNLPLTNRIAMSSWRFQISCLGRWRCNKQ